jgi:hypothetical protein
MQSVKSADRALAVSTAQYKAGTTAYLTVLTAQGTALAAERTQIDLLTRRLEASVQLVVSLGGGWDTSQLPTKQDVVKTANPPQPPACCPQSDPAAAEHQVAVVEDRALPGSDGALRLVEYHFDGAGSAVGGASPARRHAYCGSSPARAPGAATPRSKSNSVAGDKTAAQQVVVAAHHHALRLRIGGDHVQRLFGGDPQARRWPTVKWWTP